MPSRLVAVTFDAHDAAGVAVFWARLLDREVVPEPGGALLPGDETQVGLRFVTATTEKAGADRLHLHVTSTSLEDQQRTVATALARALRDRAGQRLPRRLRTARRGRL